MVHKYINDGLPKKKRGRPFAKGNVKGKPRNEILDDPGCESSVERGDIEDTPLNTLPIKTSSHSEAIENDGLILDQPQISKQGEAMEEDKPLEIVESIDFMKGNNKLSIRLTKKHNRMFRVQIFLNDGELEVRPMTYTGANTAMSFWNLLKGSLNR